MTVTKSYLKNSYQRILIESKDSYQSIFSTRGKVTHGIPLYQSVLQMIQSSSLLILQISKKISPLHLFN